MKPDVPLLMQKIDFNPATNISKLNDGNASNTVQFNFYNPITKEKLNISYCNNIPLTLKMPVKNKDKINFELYENLTKQNVDLFNYNDPAFHSRCVVIKDNEDRVLTLNTKQKKIYTNQSASCENNCQYNGLDEYEYMKCDCTGAPKEETGSTVEEKRFIDIPNVNYDIIVCWREVLKMETFQSPAFYLSIIFFVALNIAFTVLKNNAFKLIKNNLGEVIRNDAVLFDEKIHTYKYYYAGKRDPYIIDKINANILDIKPKSKIILI